MMATLSDEDREALTRSLAQLPRPVRLVFFTQSIGCEMCLPVRRLLDELTASSDRLTLEELNVVLDKERASAYGIDRAPAIVLETDGDTGIRFVGAPLGYEFSSLVEAIQLASHGDSGLTAESRARIAAVAGPLQIQVFVTPT